MTLTSIQPSLSSCPIELNLGLNGDKSDCQKRTAAVRVLHVINGEHYSGAERVQDLLAARLPECGFEVGFVCIKPEKFPRMRQFQSAPLVEAPMRTRLDLSVVRQITRLVRQQGYSLIHAHTPRSAVVASLVATRTGIPMVYHVHSPASRDTTFRLRNWLNHWTERLSLLRAAALVTVSDSLLKHMVAGGYSAKRVFSVPNGVPSPAIQRNSNPPLNTWTLGVTALFRPRKGLELLLEALAILSREGLPVRLNAVGPFETEVYENAIRHEVDRLGIGHLIHWAGFTADVPTQLAKTDLFVLPSLFGEGLPMVVLDAMAAGVPVVATRVEGVPEAIEDGISGLIANPHDPTDLARCIRSVIRGEASWSSLRQSALQRHANEFSDARMAARLAIVYRQILGESFVK